MRASALALSCALSAVSCRFAHADKPVVPPAPSDAGAAHAATPAVTDVTAQDYVALPMPTGRVRLQTADGRFQWVEVEVAASRAMRTRGMMWRVALADGKGMLFLFKQQEPLSFWMRNTLIPLDMVFIDADLKIAGIVENAEPRTLTSRSPGKPSQFVLELPGGYTRKLHIKPGTQVEFEGVGLIPVEP
ncbi:MAG: DUF192 domain-containing protein [Myxococcaceae bacterium]|nr:DUF192 domain-containing protein [Myxococcaceae bacterium]